MSVKEYIVHKVDHRGFEYLIQYNSNGRAIYKIVVQPKFITKNVNSNPTYIKDIFGNEYWIQYDLNGRICEVNKWIRGKQELVYINYENERISYEYTVLGKPVERVYDFNNILCYCKNQHGEEFWFEPGAEESYIRSKKGEKIMDFLTEEDRKVLIEFLERGHDTNAIITAMEEMKKHNELLCDAERFGWNFISKNRTLPIEFIRKYADKLDWTEVLYHQKFTENELCEFADKLDWLAVYLKYDDLSAGFLIKYRDEIRKAIVDRLYRNK